MFTTCFLRWLLSGSELHADKELLVSQVVDVELYRNSLGEDYIPQPSSSKVTHRAASPTLATSLDQSSPISHDTSAEKGMHTETLIIEAG